MPASPTVPYSVQFDNLAPIIPRNGVVTLCGYRIAARVDRGHLVIEDGVGPNRRYSRFARIGHRLKRVVVIGSNGYVSLEALRWFANQGVRGRARRGQRRLSSRREAGPVDEMKREE